MKNSEEDYTHDPFHPKHMDRAIWNTSGYYHEDEPNDGSGFFRGLGIALTLVLAGAAVATLGLILSVV